MKQAWLKETLGRLPYGLVPYILLVGIPIAYILQRRSRRQGTRS